MVKYEQQTPAETKKTVSVITLRSSSLIFKNTMSQQSILHFFVVVIFLFFSNSKIRLISMETIDQNNLPHTSSPKSKNENYSQIYRENSSFPWYLSQLIVCPILSTLPHPHNLAELGLYLPPPSQFQPTAVQLSTGKEFHHQTWLQQRLHQL